MSDGEKKDLTRIEDLSEFIHQNDPDVDAKLVSNDEEEDESLAPELPTLDDLEDNGLTEDYSADVNEEESSFDESPDADIEFGDIEEDGDDSTQFGDFNEDGDDSTEFGDFNEDGDDSTEFSDFDEVGDDQEDAADSSEFGAFDEDSGDNTPFGDFNEDDDDSTEFGDFDEVGDDQEDAADSSDYSFEESDETEQSHLDEEDVPEGDSSEEIKAPVEVELEEVRADPPQMPKNNSYREDLKELKTFGETISVGTIESGGNPPFSVMAKNITYEEDAEEILAILSECGLLTPDNENLYRRSVERGSLLISQVSEYSAIYLAHRLRRFDLDLKVGLSEEIHPSKNYDNKERGLVSRRSLRTEIKEFYEEKDLDFDIEDVIATTEKTPMGMRVLRYKDILSVHYLVDEYDLEKLRRVDHHNEKETPPLPEDHEISEIVEKYQIGMHAIYQELAAKLKEKAYRQRCNGVTNVSYSMKPIETKSSHTNQYMITCTGNAVLLGEETD